MSQRSSDSVSPPKTCNPAGCRTGLRGFRQSVTHPRWLFTLQVRLGWLSDTVIPVIKNQIRWVWSVVARAAHLPGC